MVATKVKSETYMGINERGTIVYTTLLICGNSPGGGKKTFQLINNIYICTIMIDNLIVFKLDTDK